MDQALDALLKLYEGSEVEHLLDLGGDDLAHRIVGMRSPRIRMSCLIPSEILGLSPSVVSMLSTPFFLTSSPL